MTTNTKYKYAFITILIVLIISIMTNIYQYTKQFHVVDNNIIGTYCTGDGKSQNDEYLTFMDENKYINYQQFNVLEEGKYSNSYGHLYDLKPLVNKTNTSQIVYLDDLIYRTDRNGTFKIYKKISNAPLLINIKSTDTVIDTFYNTIE